MVQVDVIETDYRRLQARVEAAAGYEAAVAAHNEFVDGVLATAFLDVRNVQASLHALKTHQCLHPIIGMLSACRNIIRTFQSCQSTPAYRTNMLQRIWRCICMMYVACLAACRRR